MWVKSKQKKQQYLFLMIQKKKGFSGAQPLL